MDFETYRYEFAAFYKIRTGTDFFVDAKGDDPDIASYQHRSYTPYEAVTDEIERYKLTDLGQDETTDREAARRTGLLN